MVTVACENCGISFDVINSRALTAKHCSMKCVREAAGIVVSCETCGKEFRTYKSKIAKYCSRDCRYTGKNKRCTNCGKRVYRQKHKLDRQWVYCSNACQSAHKTGLFTKEGHPNFISYSDVERFTDLQKQLIIGTVLGDASILKNSNGNAHLSVAHGNKQLAYINYKNRLLKPFSRDISYHDQMDKRYNKVYRTYRFFLGCHPYLTNLHEKFYPTKKKIIPKDIIESLSPLSFAFWFMDDGSANKRGNGGFIATCSFSLPEIEMACNVLKSNFGINSHPVKGNRIYLSADTWHIVKSIVSQYSIPEMEYKIS